MREQQVIEGMADEIIFYNPENGYAIFRLQTEQEEITCVGTIIELHEGEILKLTGSWGIHPTYGDQFKINLYEKAVPKTERAIEKYLASGIIKGIGEKLAERIVQKFGLETIEIMEEEPQRLSEIRGISDEKAQSISESFYEQRELREIMIRLQEFDITSTYAVKIHKKYKNQTMNIIKSNPYRLADDIFGIGFKKADQIARKMGFESNSSHRIKSGIKYVLNQAANEGNVYMPKNMLIANTSELLEIPTQLIGNKLLELQIEKQIFQEQLGNENIIYLSVFYHTEISVAKKLLEINQVYEVYDKNTVKLLDKKIKIIEKQLNIKLADNQKKAVKEVMNNGVLIITGGPGTGKTTTINTIINLLESQGDEILLTAPTGRAAKRMTEATGKEAMTIHRLLEVSYLQKDDRYQRFERNGEHPIEADVVIVDEASMIDIMLMNSLLDAITPETKLIFAGDSDQLPSVGPGNVLKDIIKSGCIKVVKLDKIFRQAEESAIITNAHKINEGIYPDMNEKDKDFFFMKRTSPDSIVETILQLIIKRLPSYIGSNKKSDIQIIAPMRKGGLGINSLNQILQDRLNPPDKNKQQIEFKNLIYRDGDKVMQIKNNYNTVWYMIDSYGRIIEEGAGIFNGDTGVIIHIDKSNFNVTVLFDDNKIVKYENSQLDELELAYAITIHKSQGSEYPAVIIPIYTGPEMLMSRNLLYTAVTRAKKLVVIVGLQETVNKMVDNNKEINRYTMLDYRLQYIDKYTF